MRVRSHFISAFALTLQFFVTLDTSALSGTALPEAYLRRKSSTICGFLSGRWKAGEVKRSKFYSFAAEIADANRKLTRARGLAARRLRRQIAAWRTKNTKQQRFCRTIANPRKVSSILRLPSNSKFVSATTATTGVQTVSGTPPLLQALPSSDVKSLFWPAGVIEAVAAGTPSPTQCQQYSAGAADGEHGGVASCQMVNNLGYALTPVLRAGVSLCYLQNGAALQGNGVQLAKGAYPNSDRQQLFDPTGSAEARLVKISVINPGLPPLFVRVFPRSQNVLEGNHYRAEFWSCWSGRGWADSHQSLTVSSAGLYTYTYADNEGSSAGGYQFTVTAGLKVNTDGVVVFDESSDRRAVTAFLDPENLNFGFKSDIVVTAGNILRNKNRWLFDYGYRMDHLVMEFSGSDLSNLSYLQGALKSEDHNDGVPVNYSSLGIEFRDAYYAMAPASSLISVANSTDFATDSFYADAPAVSIDLTSYPCDPETDVEITLDASQTEVSTVLSQCQGNTLWDSNICQNTTELQQSYTGWQTHCG